MPCSPDHRDPEVPVRPAVDRIVSFTVTVESRHLHRPCGVRGPSDAKGGIGYVVMTNKRLICAKPCYVPAARSAGTPTQAISKPFTASTTMYCTQVLTASPPGIASNAYP